MKLGVFSFFIVFIFISFTGLGSPICSIDPSPKDKGSSFELGLVLQSLFPTRLAEFDFSFPSYGPLIGIPLWGNHLEIQGLYGSTDVLSLQLVEVNYRFLFDSPHLSLFFLVGAHYLHYSVFGSGENYEFQGPLAGVGLTFLLAHRFFIIFNLKTYFQITTMLNVGGGIKFLL